MSDILQGLQTELDKIKGKMQNENHIANFSHAYDYAGNQFVGIVSEIQNLITSLHIVLNAVDRLKPGSWILDTGATTHMCTNLKNFIKLSSTSHPISIRLPDGSTTCVTQFGDII